jgi:hypothetical protein
MKKKKMNYMLNVNLKEKSIPVKETKKDERGICYSGVW